MLSRRPRRGGGHPLWRPPECWWSRRAVFKVRRAVQPHSHLQMRRSNRPGGCGVHQDGGAPRPVQRERSTRVSGDLHGHPPTLLRITASGGENVPGTLIGRMAEGAAIVLQRSERLALYRHGVAPKDPRR